MPTLKEVAKRADVSTATVSKVLSNTPYVSEETRMRVLHAIEELGYIPNLAARALSKGHTYIIGVIFPYNYDHLFADPLILNMLEGIETICTERGYNVLLSTPRVPVADSVLYQRLVRSGYLDGVIAIETLPGEPMSTALERNGYLWVVIGYHSGTGTGNTLHPDDFAGARAIAAYTIGLGHRRIGIIGVEPDALDAAERRLSGYRAAFEEAGLDFSSVPQVVGTFSVESGYQVAGQLLECAPRLTAILCLNDRMAMGAIQRASAEGRQVPADLSVLGFDDIPGAELFSPPLTTVRQPVLEMGQRAADLLFDMIDRRTRHKNARIQGFAPIVFPTELIIRGSAMPPKG